MNKNFITTLIIFLFSAHSLMAESGAIDFMNSTGKIYSVIAVVVVVFIGLAIVLFRLERKITKLENQVKNGHKTS